MATTKGVNKGEMVPKNPNTSKATGKKPGGENPKQPMPTKKMGGKGKC